MQFLPPEAMHAYQEAAKARDLLPMFYLESVSGLQKGELVALRWNDVDIQSKTISVQQAVCPTPGRHPGAHPAQDGKLCAAGIYSAGGD